MHGIDFIQDLAVILLVAGVVGWLCQRIGLSVVVGYLAAGMLVGPNTPPVAFVSNVDRVETFAQVGLVFLMFGIGLRLSVRKLRRLGLALMGATFFAALVMYYASRVFGVALGWSGRETLFLAAMLMVSSSAIIGKILHELGATHERAGQLAMGVSVLEDVVAVVMLTLLTSVVQIGSEGGAQVMQTLLLLGAPRHCHFYRAPISTAAGKGAGPTVSQLTAACARVCPSPPVAHSPPRARSVACPARPPRPFSPRC